MNPIPAMLLLELQPLRELCQWPTVGAHLEAIRAATHDGEGLTHHEILRIRTWSARWSTLHPTLRNFYVSHSHTDERVGAALFHIIDARRPNIATRTAIISAWREYTGSSPWLELLPDLSHVLP